ncbi:hypothetical protein DPMN_063979 [Dreissena polymorpha]|uniref:Uncharacterized protein n=1 Tax=Dreissena polymorpha TaxID=45954 RepID=A0A9D4CCT8_DREPO|nr:hypothetical protein DPMN_063979 [Dreissena polymorpha]
MLIQDEKKSEVETFETETNTLTANTQLCVMNLLSEGVGVNHVKKVIKHVAQFCGRTVEKLPSVRTINRIGDQRAGVAYMHISEELGCEKDTTLQSDETRKSGSCYEVFSVRDSSEKEWVIGLKDMINKSSDNCLATLKLIINDINDCTNTSVGKQILAEIKNTMSDRAATEKKFQELLKA